MTHPSSSLVIQTLVAAKDTIARMSLLSEAELIEFGEEMTRYGRPGDNPDKLACMLMVRIAEVFKDDPQ